MRKIFLLIFFFFLGSQDMFALEIVYPKTNPVKINAPSTFFIGSVNPGEKLKINNIDVNVSSIGAFAQVVQLNVGVNNFKIVSMSAKTNEIASVDNSSKAEAAMSRNDVVNFTI